MKKMLIALTMSIAMMATTIPAYAETAQEVIAKNPTSYTAGTSSVYGAKLNQDQLNAVAQAAADFKTNYVNDSMNNDQKIRAGYDYIKNNVAYIDWRESTYANTAYGCLVEKKAACSGITRAFVALMDAVDVKAYWIHGATNDHQWNMVEFNDGFYFIDIDANIASGAEFIYKAATHPYSYDTAAYPAIGSKSGGNTSGNQNTEGWVQDNAGWWYRNADGSYPVNAWKAINGKWYYFEANGYMAANKWINGTYYVGVDGAMYANATTPDGYQVGADGAWIQGQQNVNTTNDGVHTMRASDPEEFYRINCSLGSSPWKQYQKETHEGVECIVLDHNVGTFSFESSKNDLDPTNHQIWVVGYQFYNGVPVAIGKNGEPIVYTFEYDKEYSLDFTGTGKNAKQLAEYCIQNNILVQVSVVDVPAFGVKSPNSISFDLFYASANSVPTGEVGQ